LALLPLAAAAPAHGAGDLTKQDPITVTVQLGDERDGLRFVPERLSFETGKLYKLELYNASPQKHYFSSEGLSRSVFTRKVQVNGADGKAIAEVKGTIREIEVYPGQKAEWWFVPIQSGTFGDLKCSIGGHAEGGMVGTIVVE